MNEQNETPKDELEQSAPDTGAIGAEDATNGTETAATGALELSAADAATDVSKPRLNAYEQWQAKYDEHLMDGTSSLSSYIRLAAADGIEYGIQPRLIPHGHHLHLAGIIRVAHIKRKVESEDQPMVVQPTMTDVEETEKVQQLRAFVGNKGPWLKHSADRISVPYNYTLPINPTQEGALEQFVALVENGQLFDKIIARLPAPVSGWDYSELRRARSMFNEYLRITANQFSIFKKVTVEEFQWTDETEAAGELSAEAVKFLSWLDAPQEGGNAESDD